MERKYKVNSATSVINMIVEFSSVESSDPIIIHVGVDCFNNKVFFEDDPIEGVDYQDLEQEILCFLRPPMLEPPKLNPEVLQRILDVRSGKYGTNTKEYGVGQ